MSDLFWLSNAQMARLAPFFPKSHGKPRVEDPDAVLAEIAATNAKLDGLGLVLDSDPRRVTKTGSAQAGDPSGDPAVPASEPEKE